MNQLSIITLNAPDITDFAEARNLVLAKANSEWVLFLDKDEELSPALKQEIDQAIKSSDFAAYTIPRRDIFLGKELKYGETGSTKIIRLARSGSGRFIRPVHEVWEINGKIGSLQNPLIHQPHASLSSFLTKIDKYSSIDAQFRFANKERSSLFHLFAYPAAKFFRNYLWLQGFRDGVPGTAMAIIMSFHSYLTWAKLYLLWQKN